MVADATAHRSPRVVDVPGQPGFCVLPALAGLGVAAWLLRVLRRSEGDR